MIILCHVHAYPPDHNAGAEWMLHHMLKWIKEHHKEDTIIVATQDPTVTDFEGIQIINEAGPVHIRNYYRKADIVISHLGRVGKVINNIRVVDKPAMFLMHNSHDYSSIRIIAHRSVLCFNSEYTKAAHQYGKDSVIVQPPCPVDYYKTNRGGAKVVTLINHCKKKGADLFHALAEAMPGVEFMAVRGDYYHQEKVDLDNVTYKENTPRITKQYALTKILLMPSSYESFGRTAIEAAASGIPTIAAPTPGLQESLGEAGIFIPIDNQPAWEEEITKLLRDKDYYKDRSDMAKRRARELEEAFAPQMKDFYKLLQKAIDRKVKEPRQ